VMESVISTETVLRLRELFGDRLGEAVSMAPYTSARIGGPADFLLEVRSAEDLAEVTRQLLDEGVPFRILGGGSNILVSDRWGRLRDWQGTVGGLDWNGGRLFLER